MADGARATLGITVSDYAVTDEDVGVGLEMSPGECGLLKSLKRKTSCVAHLFPFSHTSVHTGGASWGRVKRPDTILRAARRLVEASDVI